MTNLSTNMSEKKWYAIYTRPRFEKKAEKYLNQRNISCYLPLIKTMRQWSDRKKLVELPLFSSYIFVYITNKDHVNVLKAPGVVKYVSFEGKAVEIPEKQIENIRWLLSTDVESDVINESITPGSQVEIIKGPLMGLKAEMVHYKNKNIIIIRLNQLDKSIGIQVPESHVKVITSI